MPSAPINRLREANLARLSREFFELAIIGGGITGAAIARDAAMRGITTALVDKGDFASATSSRSTKLIHGGLRYLPQGEFRLVREALRERERLRHLTAPHLVRSIEFLFPFYAARRPSRVAVSAGLVLYDLFARIPRPEHHRRLTRGQVHALEPALKEGGLKGGAVYLDAFGDDARLTIENIIDAAQHGAVIANYVAAEGFEQRAPGMKALFVRDVESGREFELRARLVVNATGPWVDEIRRLDEPDCRPSVRLSKGIHLVVRRNRLPIHHALVLTAHAGRIIFLIPSGDYILIGTTDTDFVAEKCQVQVEAADIQYLLETIAQSLPDIVLNEHDVAASYAGLRTLRASNTPAPFKVTREEIILESNSGLITVAGGKLTTHRAMAARIVDGLMKKLGRLPGRSPTLERPLPGARTVDGAEFSAPLPSQLQQIINDRYGSCRRMVLRIAAERPDLTEPLVPGAPAIGAEVLYTVRHEFARTVADFLVRRTAMSWRAPVEAAKAAPRVVQLMAAEFGWDARRQAQENDWQCPSG